MNRKTTRFYRLEISTALPTLLTALLLSLSLVGNAGAQATKAATSSGDIVIVTGTGGTFTAPFSDILSTSIKVPQGFNDLLITVSAATALATNDTRVSSTGSASALTNVGIDVQVLVDGGPVVPVTGPAAPFVTWDNQFKLLETLFTANTITVDDQTLYGVRAFTFTQAAVGPGEHLVEVQARYRFMNTDLGPLSSFTAAVIGPRTLVVEGVNLK